MSLNLILADTNHHLILAFQHYFKNLPNVSFYHGKFEEVPEYDAMVSAANSFGLMDGGVDFAITQYFGELLMSHVQEHILRYYLGEQPVGNAFVINTGHDAHPWLVHAPTMRVPDIIAGTDATYRATWAALIAIHTHNQSASTDKIKSVVFPGMGTGCGQVPANSAAAQMALAWRHYCEHTTVINWPQSINRHKDVCNSVRGLIT